MVNTGHKAWVCCQSISRNVHCMPRARKHLVCLDETPYYHVTSRCVRRAFLCGVDRYSGQSYEHRRGWIETRIRVLSSLFTINVCAYAVMSNHYHLVVHINPSESEQWSDAAVLERWTCLFKGPSLVQRFLAGEELLEAEEETLRAIVAVYRQRLSSLSWFMRCLNEPIARKANAEDRCTGHFWEARFHSQALCTEAALLTAMAYVDLNPIRAGTAKTPESSDYTSIRTRILGEPADKRLALAIRELIKKGDLEQFADPVRPLMRFSGNKPNEPVLPMTEAQYIELVDSTGRIAHRNKHGQIDPQTKPILERLGLSTDAWCEASLHFRSNYWNGQLRTKRIA